VEVSVCAECQSEITVPFETRVKTTRSATNIWTETQTILLRMMIRVDGVARFIQENVLTLEPGQTTSLDFWFRADMTGLWEIEVMALDPETLAPLAPSAFAYVTVV